MRVWVTGAGGFVGAHLTARLRRDGCDVHGADREVDVRDPEALRRVLSRLAPDAIVHLAAQSSVARSWQAGAETWEINYLGAAALIQVLEAETPRARLLLVGSGDVYGPLAPGQPPFAEPEPLRPASPYARAKACAEILGQRSAERGFAVYRLRPFNHTGAGQSDRFALSSFARQLAEMEVGLRAPELEVGSLDSTRDFLAVEDVVDAYASLLSGSAPADTYNIASGRELRIGSLLERLIERSRVRPQVRIDPARVRPADRSAGCPERLRAAAGWQPRTPIDRALESLLEDWRRRVRAA